MATKNTSTSTNLTAIDGSLIPLIREGLETADRTGLTITEIAFNADTEEMTITGYSPEDRRTQYKLVLGY